MFSVIQNLMTDHIPTYTILSLIVLGIGGFFTLQIMDRAKQATDSLKTIWIFLAGILGGGSIWTMHFLSMLSHQHEAVNGYEPFITLLSLATGTGFSLIAFAIYAHSNNRTVIVASGMILGFGISIMHYTGVSAMNVSGWVEWNNWLNGASIMLGCMFGALTSISLAHQHMRYNKLIASLFGYLAVSSVHFISMVAMEIKPMDIATNSSNLISSDALGVEIILVLVLLVCVIYVAFRLEHVAIERAKEFKRFSYNCPLTSAYNRFGIEQKALADLERAKTEQERFAVVQFDLDRFKQINDVYGHEAGDAVLCHIAKRLNEELCHYETLGRIGGDEFIIAKFCYHDEQDIFQFCEKVQRIISHELEWNGTNLSATASIGFATYPEDCTSTEDLFTCADLAVQRAKAGGKNRIVKYDTKTDEAHRQKSIIAQKLDAALRNGEIEVYFQQQNNSSSKSICGVEALARWHDAELGHISPGVFIPIAEETKLIIALGDYMLERACIEAVNWPHNIGLAVNVAAAQLVDINFPVRVRKILNRTGFMPQRLELEITESSIIADRDAALAVVKHLKQIGIRIVMDDFGTGYSSLATLHQFSFDKIKIDREFVKSIHENPQTESIVKSTIFLAKSLDIKVLAEGVESQEQLDFLSHEGCREVQGFLFGKPLSAKDMSDLIAQKHAKIVSA